MRHPSILFLNCGAICYDSTLYFEQAISSELQKRGWHTEHLSVDKKNPAPGLAPCYGRQYDVIFDINTILPAASDENGALCLNQIGGQVWHYIIDHPFYHHDVLKSPLENYHVLCLDENHAAFIRKHYPHIKRVTVLPLAASQAAEYIPYTQRKDDIIFTGTYTDPDTILYQAKKQSADLADLFEKTVALLLEHPGMPQEEAVCRILPGHDDKLPEILQLNYRADLYLQACIREELLKQFLLQKLPVTVYGHGWELFQKKCSPSVPDVPENLRCGGEFHYDRMPALYANAKIALNQTPWFTAGMHDRVPLALQNGSVCMTEQCPYLEKRLTHAKELYYFSLEDMEGAAGLAGYLLHHPSEAEEVAECGQRYASAQLGWERWAELFLENRDVG